MRAILIIFLTSLAFQAWADFLTPDRIKNDVDFWAKVYREWDTHQAVFYDSKSKAVYDVLDLPIVENELSSARYRKDVEKRLRQISQILKNRSLETPLDPLAEKIEDIVKLNGLWAETDLADRLKVQSGLRRQFEQGLKISGRYADDIHAILKAEKLPQDLMAIVFVESLFNLSTVSHAGAVGPWGIVKETALRSGIHVNNFTDERLDWVLATYAAAQYLKRAKEGLTEWPLVITSYNYGYPGMMRAANTFGKDFEAIFDNHASPIFGYASKSYYAEFLAALDTLKNQETHFPGIKKEHRLTYDTVQVQRPVDVLDLKSHSIIKEEDLKKLNPALTKRTLHGQEVLPANYALRIPKGQSGRFYQDLKKINTQERQKASSKISVKYRAKANQTLSSIARLFGVSEDYLSKKMNKPLNYKPKGVVLIRSEAHNYSNLLELNKNILNNISSGQQLEKPAEIGVAER